MGGTARSPRDGALVTFDGQARSPDVAARLDEVTHVLVSIPPMRTTTLPPVSGGMSAQEGDSFGGESVETGGESVDTGGESVDAVLRHHGADLAGSPSLEWVGLLSTVGVYGDHDGEWVDETTPPLPGLERTRRRLRAEQEWSAWGAATRTPVQIFRLAGIYGPGRSVLDRIRAPGARRIVKPGSIFNRIHVDDIVGAVEAGIRRPDRTGAFNLSDDEPASSHEVLTWASSLLGVEPPPEVAFEAAGLSAMARSFYAENRRVRSVRVEPELGYRLRFPTYREGLAALAGLTGSRPDTR